MSEITIDLPEDVANFTFDEEEGDVEESVAVAEVEEPIYNNLTKAELDKTLLELADYMPYRDEREKAQAQEPNALRAAEIEHQLKAERHSDLIALVYDMAEQDVDYTPPQKVYSTIVGALQTEEVQRILPDKIRALQHTEDITSEDEAAHDIVLEKILNHRRDHL